LYDQRYRREFATTGKQGSDYGIAASLASYFDAHLTGIAFILWPVIACAKFGPAEAKFIKEQDAAAKQAADAALERLAFEVRRENISWDSHEIAISVDGAPGRFAEIARAFDIAVVAQADPDGNSIDELIAQAALFQSGHPILIVPYVQKAAFKVDRILILWDGGATATRAIVGAVPFLHRAQQIDLVSIAGERDLREELAGADMVKHLSRHGVKAQQIRVQMVDDVSTTILNHAAENAPDLLVMGGYGHSRFREIVLGGATRGILQSMTVPTLMSH
jgi:nucleotide-binding universal stress UspA family protein